MHKREQRREVPDRYPYIVVGVPGHGDHFFRLPSAIAAARFGALQSEDSDGGVAAMGALIGATWWHEYSDLDTTVPRIGTVPSADMLAVGEAVVEELHEAGYPSGLVGMLAAALWKAIRDANTLDDEVAERIAFFTGSEAPPAPSRTPPSTATSGSSPGGSAPSTP